MTTDLPGLSHRREPRSHTHVRNSASDRGAFAVCPRWSWGSSGLAVHDPDSQGNLSLTLVPAFAWPCTVQGVNAEADSGVRNRDAGLSLSTSCQAPAPLQPRLRCVPTAVAARPRPDTLAHLSAGLLWARQPKPPAGFQGLGLWAESAQGGIYLKSHRKVKLGSKKSFCRWFIKNAKEADHSHSLNVSDSCKVGMGQGSSLAVTHVGQGVSCPPLQLSAVPQGAGLRRTEGGLEVGILSLPFEKPLFLKHGIQHFENGGTKKYTI